MKWWQRFRRFLQDVWSELHRVVWPSRQSVVEHTVLVIITVAIIGILLWLVDLGGQYFLRQIILYLVG